MTRLREGERRKGGKREKTGLEQESRQGIEAGLKPGRPEEGGLGRSHDRTSTEHQMRENGD